MRTVKSHLAAIVIAAALPGLVFGLWASWLLAAEMKTKSEQTAERIVAAMATNIAEHLGLVTTALKVLAQSPPLRDGDLAGTYGFAVKLAADIDQPIGVASPDGTQLFNTRRPFGSELPRRADAVSYTRALQTGGPSVSDVIVGAIVQRPLFTIDVPIPETALGPVVLATSSDTTIITGILRRTKVDPGWAATVVDGNGKLLARTVDADGAGTEARPRLAEVAKSRRQAGVLDNQDGAERELLTFYNSIPGTGWVVFVDVPKAALRAPFRRSLRWLSLGGSSLLVITMLLAYRLARRIHGSAIGLEAAVNALAREEEPQRSSAVAEFDRVSDVLFSVSTALRERQARLQTALRERDWLASALELSATIIRDREGRIRYWTIGCEQLYGWSKDEARGAISHSLLKTEFPVPMADIEAALTRDGRWRGELHHRAKDGRPVRVAAHWVLATDDRQEAVVVESVNDITGQTRAEAALHEARDKAERAAADAQRAVSSKARFFAAASHDLRQPLQAMSLFLDVLRPTLHESKPQALLANIERAQRAAAELLNALLDVAKLDAGIIMPSVVAVDLDRLIDEVAAECRPLAVMKGLNVRVRRCHRQALTDPLMLERIIRNLTLNAIRYTDRGGVLIACRCRGRQIQLEVWDTGRGIPGDQRHLIWEEFYQVGNRERDSAQGLGLGLSIVQRLANLLGCEIDVKSRVGRGSVFFVRLPVAEGETASSQSAMLD